MITVTVSDAALRQAAEEGMDEFVKVFIDGIQKAIGGQLTNENMARLNADQITLLGWSYLHEEVSDGGYVQLIYNGLGAFIFKNPFANGDCKTSTPICSDARSGTLSIMSNWSTR